MSNTSSKRDPQDESQHQTILSRRHGSGSRGTVGEWYSVARVEEEEEEEEEDSPKLIKASPQDTPQPQP